MTHKHQCQHIDKDGHRCDTWLAYHNPLKQCPKHVIETIDSRILKGAVVVAAVVAVNVAPRVLKAISRGETADGDDYYCDPDDPWGEALSLSDAADIYLSSGFDEDYSFGYTHDELNNELS